MNETPKGDRIHIGIFGRRNAGKSSLINALTGQDLAIVSEEAGTTTDPVTKAMELHPIGPVVFTDTAGLDDEGELGDQRTDRTRRAMDSTDIAILVIDGEMPEALRSEKTRSFAEDGFEPEKRWLHKLQSSGVPTIIAINKSDLSNASAGKSVAKVLRLDGDSAPLCVSALTGEGIGELRNAIAEAAAKISGEEVSPVADVEEGSLVLLVMPQDIQAPKGRLILPQVQTIRALLDRKCTVVSTTADGLARSLDELARDPDLIITDSQCFRQVAEEKPASTPLTSFSILMAKAKGDMDVFVHGAKAIDDLLTGGSVAAPTRAPGSDGPTDTPGISDAPTRAPRILIAEACTHVPQSEDIGTVKIPRLLRKKLGEHIEITNVRGSDFPDVDDLKNYDLIIHCGACMFNRRHVMTRIAAAKEAGVPITNYGVFLAKMSGILDRHILPNL